jgi:hypothetical protein
MRGRLNVGYPSGAAAYFAYIDGWRKSGSFEGLAFDGSAAMPRQGDAVPTKQPASGDAPVGHEPVQLGG